jgi:ribonuclease HII
MFLSISSIGQGFTPYLWLDSPDTDEKCFFEREAAAAGAGLIAGVDEAGRGPLAGPIVAAAVILGGHIKGVDDSKRLTARAREALFGAITGGGHAVGVAVVPAERIDRIGIQAANYEAMANALAALDPRPDFALVDGLNIPGCLVRHRRIVKGDQRSWSIGAASIVAKVTRDRLMLALDAQHPQYGFARHKGYGTAAHLEALARFGPCPAHRRSFAPLAAAAETMSLIAERNATA